MKEEKSSGIESQKTEETEERTKLMTSAAEGDLRRMREIKEGKTTSKKMVALSLLKTGDQQRRENSSMGERVKAGIEQNLTKAFAAATKSRDSPKEEK